MTSEPASVNTDGLVIAGRIVGALIALGAFTRTFAFTQVTWRVAAARHGLNDDDVLGYYHEHR